MPRIVWSGPWEQRPERIFLGSRSTRERRRSKNEDESGRPRAYLGGSKSMSLQVAEEWAVSSADVFDVARVGIVGLGTARACSSARSSQAIVRSLAHSLSPAPSCTPAPDRFEELALGVLRPVLSTSSAAIPRTTPSTTPSPSTVPRARSNPRHPVSSLSERAHRPPVPDDSIPPYAIFSSRNFRHWRVSL
jgi:hypothetical protein